jgi:hypothetical protein
LIRTQNEIQLIFFFSGLFLYLTIKGKNVPPDEFFHAFCWGPALAAVIVAASSEQMAEIPMFGYESSIGMQKQLTF